jgi:hypothetical protein
VPPPLTPPGEGGLLARAFNVDCENPSSFAKLARYDGSPERSSTAASASCQTYQPRPPAQPNPGRSFQPRNRSPTRRNARRKAIKKRELPFEPKNGGIAQTSAAAIFLRWCSVRC